MNLPQLPSRPKCQLCELHQGVGVNGHVGVPGIRLQGLEPSPDHVPLVFIGMNPGTFENERNVPFVGKSGDLLRNVLIEGFNLRALATVYLLNAARCYTPPQSPPKDKHYAACFVWLQEDLTAIYAVHRQPLVICALGAGPVKTLVKRCIGPRASGDLKRAIQRPATHLSLPDGTPFVMFAAFHPAYILRNKPAIHAACDQFALIRDFLTGGLPEPSAPDIIEPRSPRRHPLVSSLPNLPAH